MTVEHVSPEQISSFRAEKGSTAISIEIVPRDVVTAIIDDGDLDRALRGLERALNISEAQRADPAFYAGVRRGMADLLVPQNFDAIVEFDENLARSCAVLAVWCALNHPRDGGEMRARMERLREEGKAPHFTICRGAQGAYGTVVGEGYVDIRDRVAGRIDPNVTIMGTL
jgi:hypothetical protein